MTVKEACLLFDDPERFGVYVIDTKVYEALEVLVEYIRRESIMA